MKYGFIFKVVSWMFDLEARVDDTVGLHGGDSNIGDPEADKDAGGDSLDSLGATKLATNGRVSSGQQNDDGNQGLSTENGDRETEILVF